MKRWLWQEDRLAWPAVALIAYVAISLVAVDYAWRRITLPFESFMIYALLIDAALGALMIAAFVLQHRRER